jgi:hypothetical protein
MGWIILVTNAAATLSLVGLIWFVQVVHYPLMATLPSSEAPRYAVSHQRRTMWVVGPLMLAEAITGFLLLAIHPERVSPLAATVGCLLILFIAYRTWWIHRPQHHRLARKPDPKTCRDLIHTNWLRTIAWTARGGLLLVLIASCMYD